eukprot:5431454-Pleurochrysis_carterae.AAC.4
MAFTSLNHDFLLGFVAVRENYRCRSIKQYVYSKVTDFARPSAASLQTKKRRWRGSFLDQLCLLSECPTGTATAATGAACWYLSGGTARAAAAQGISTSAVRRWKAERPPSRENGLLEGCSHARCRLAGRCTVRSVAGGSACDEVFARGSTRGTFAARSFALRRIAGARSVVGELAVGSAKATPLVSRRVRCMWSGGKWFDGTCKYGPSRRRMLFETAMWSRESASVSRLALATCAATVASMSSKSSCCAASCATAASIWSKSARTTGSAGASWTEPERQRVAADGADEKGADEGDECGGDENGGDARDGDAGV